MLDARLLQPKEDFSKLPETYVIFITENDTIGKNRPIYFVERKLDDSKEAFGDGSYIIYVNGSDDDSGTALGRLMHDFSCTDADDMYYDILARKTRDLKETKEGTEHMGSIVDELNAEVAKANSVEIARKMLTRGKDSLDEIAEITGLTIEEVESLKGTLSA